MSKLNKILWSLVMLFIVVTTVILSFGIILVGVAVVGLFGIYRYYFLKKRSRKFKTGPKGYACGEVIDLQAEVIHQTIQAKNPDK